MDDEDDIFATMGGSLLNDLLADLDNTKNDDFLAFDDLYGLSFLQRKNYYSVVP